MHAASAAEQATTEHVANMYPSDMVVYFPGLTLQHAMLLACEAQHLLRPTGRSHIEAIMNMGANRRLATEAVRLYPDSLQAAANWAMDRKTAPSPHDRPRKQQVRVRPGDAASCSSASSVAQLGLPLAPPLPDYGRGSPFPPPVRQPLAHIATAIGEQMPSAPSGFPSASSGGRAPVQGVGATACQARFAGIAAATVPSVGVVMGGPRTASMALPAFWPLRCAPQSEQVPSAPPPGGNSMLASDAMQRPLRPSPASSHVGNCNTHLQAPGSMLACSLGVDKGLPALPPTRALWPGRQLWHIGRGLASLPMATATV